MISSWLRKTDRCTKSMLATMCSKPKATNAKVGLVVKSCRQRRLISWCWESIIPPNADHIPHELSCRKAQAAGGTDRPVGANSTQEDLAPLGFDDLAGIGRKDLVNVRRRVEDTAIAVLQSISDRTGGQSHPTMIAMTHSEPARLPKKVITSA